MAGPMMTTSIFQKPWSKDMDHVYMDEYQRVGMESSSFCKNETAYMNMEYARKSIMAGLGPSVSMNEGTAIPFDSFVDGPEKVVRPAKFGQQIAITDEARKSDRHGIYSQIASQLAKGDAYAVELMNTDLLNSAFSSSVRVGADNKALCASDHPLYGYAGGTYSNLQTGTLSKTFLQQARNKFSKLVNERNIPIVMRATTLYIPIELESIAQELLMSELDPESGENAINPLTKDSYNGSPLKYKVLRFLTSTTAWFLGCNVNEQDLQSIEFTANAREEYRDSNVQATIYSTTFRRTPTFWNWRGWVGSTGA